MFNKIFKIKRNKNLTKSYFNVIIIINYRFLILKINKQKKGEKKWNFIKGKQKI